MPLSTYIGPGMEGWLHVPGYPHPCVIYVPTDYAPGVRLSLVLYFHGYGGGPTTWPLQDATQGKGYLIVGLSYGSQADGGEHGFQDDPASCHAMLRFLETVRNHLKTIYIYDEQQVILAGFSMGGYAVMTLGLCSESRELYCGYCIIAAGAKDRPYRFMVASDRPVLLLNGAFDPNLPDANRGKERLTKAGAIVTQVVLPGEPHVPSLHAMGAPIRDWLDAGKRLLDRARKNPSPSWTASPPNKP
jgi:predicted esterase